MKPAPPCAILEDEGRVSNAGEGGFEAADVVTALALFDGSIWPTPASDVLFQVGGPQSSAYATVAMVRAHHVGDSHRIGLTQKIGGKRLGPPCDMAPQVPKHAPVSEECGRIDLPVPTVLPLLSQGEMALAQRSRRRVEGVT